jgi:hypothetical protein
MSTDIFMLDILLARAESHPEEFGASGKWMRIIDHYDDCMTEEEKKKVIDALYKARRVRFNQALMEALAGEGEPLPTESPQDSFVFSSANRTIFSSPLTTTSTHIKLHEDMKAGLLEEVERLKQEREMDAMHEYYKDMGATK